MVKPFFSVASSAASMPTGREGVDSMLHGVTMRSHGRGPSDVGGSAARELQPRERAADDGAAIGHSQCPRGLSMVAPANAPHRESAARPLAWIGSYQRDWLFADCLAGVTLAAYAVPVALAYATLAGLAPVVGIYGYMLGGLAYAVLGSSPHLAIGPTSAISLLVGASIAPMAAGDPARLVQVASLAALLVAGLAATAWALRLSTLTSFVSDTILLGFKAGAGLSIAATQLPAAFGVPGGGDHFLERIATLLHQLGDTNLIVLAVATGALVLLLLGDRLLPGRPVALAVVAVSIVATAVLRLPDHGGAPVGAIPPGVRPPGNPGARCRRRRGARGGMPAAGVCRGRIGRAGAREQARLRDRRSPGAARPGGRQSHGRPRARVSGGGRAVAVGREREGGRPVPARAGRGLRDPGCLPGVLHEPAAKSPEGRAGRHRARRGEGPDRPAGNRAAPPREPSRVPGCDGGPGGRPAPRHPEARAPGRGRLDPVAPVSRGLPPPGHPRSHAEHHALLRPRAPSRQRAAADGIRLSRRGVAHVLQR